MRQFTRLTNAFSKKIENHEAAIAPHHMHYNFARYTGYSITTLHRMFSDLTHLFEGELQRGGRPKIILGGDFNASPQWDDKYRVKTHRIFFQRLEAFGLVDCQEQFTKDRPRALRHSKGRVPFPWVNDYIFASTSLVKKTVAHQVIERPEMLNLSDHNPVVVKFDL